MATGHPPVRGDSPLAVLRRVSEEQPRTVHDINESMPTWLNRMIAQFLNKSAERRIGSAEEAVELLRACLAHVRAPSRMQLPSAIRGQSTWRKKAIAGGLVACALISTLLVLAWIQNPPQNPITTRLPPGPLSLPPAFDQEEQILDAQFERMQDELKELINTLKDD